MSSSVFVNNTECEANKVRYIFCERWQVFTTEITNVKWLTTNENKSEVGGVIYRGHASTEWKLSSKLERTFYPPNGMMDYRQTAKGWYEEVSKGILNKFKLLAQGIKREDSPKSDDEFWALGRHYGLLTPLLDWTESPYIAAFFAFIELYKSLEFKIVPEPFFLREDKVHIWGLRRWADLEVKGEFDVVSLPRTYGSRLWAQAGLFTRLTASDHLDIQAYLESRGLAHLLKCYELPCRCAATALLDLQLMNITFSKLFPDLYGSAQEANVSDLYLRAFQMQNQLWEEDRIKKAKT